MPGVDHLPSAPPAPCPCGRGNVAAEVAHQRPLVELAIAGDSRALTELYEDNVDDLYRYLRAWTADDAAARDLTWRVFHGALAWLPALAESDGELAAWLMTMARDAVVEDHRAGWTAGSTQAPDVLVAASQLDDAQREVVVLRLLLGHSLAHTAHLTGSSVEVVSGLQLAACSTIWELLSGFAVEPVPPESRDLRPRWFEDCLEDAYYDPGMDPGLADLLAVADALRQAAPQQVPLPDDGFVRRLRGQLLGELGGDDARFDRSAGGIGRAFALARLQISRHPWVVTVVAASAIGLVFGLQIASHTGTRSACGDQPCLSSTTEATLEQAGAAPPPIPTLGPTTIFTNTSAPPTTNPPSTQARAPASTAPPTTAAHTTRTTQRETTTTRRRTTTTQEETTTTRRPERTTTTTTPEPNP